MASAHVMVDGYGNIYAPLLPLLIPKLDLSLAGGGYADDALSAVGVGGADWIRAARRSLAAAPARDDRSGGLGLPLEPDRSRQLGGNARGDSRRRRTGRGRFPSAGRGARASPRRRATRPGDVGLHHRRNPRLLARSVDVRAVRGALHAWLDAAARDPRAPRRRLLPDARAADAAAVVGRWRAARAGSVREAARPALRDRRAAHADGHLVRDLRAGDADAARAERLAGGQLGRAVSLRERPRRVSRRTVGGSVGREARDSAGRSSARRRSSSPRRSSPGGRLSSCWRSAASSCSRRSR